MAFVKNEKDEAIYTQSIKKLVVKEKTLKSTIGLGFEFVDEVKEEEAIEFNSLFRVSLNAKFGIALEDVKQVQTALSAVYESSLEGTYSTEYSLSEENYIECCKLIKVGFEVNFFVSVVPLHPAFIRQFRLYKVCHILATYIQINIHQNKNLLDGIV